ncbi:MAG: helix-turn-helix domain-containing protein [Treponema sp.]|nr:helix-turn-helix domain-containing protein [Treponema sp.]
MESLGEKLKTAREARGLDYEQVCRETNISVRYLQALETEYFDQFPGEPYITGFLRTYGAYLDLDVPELISLYRSLKIQEQPVPVEQLLKKPSSLPKIILISAIVLVVLGVVGGSLHYFTSRPEKPEVQAPAKHQAAEYTMTGDSLERRLYPGDTILIPYNDTQYKLELGSLGDTVTILTPNGTEMLELGQSADVDLNMSGDSDVQVTVADFVKNKADMGALLRVELIPRTEAIAAASPGETNATAPANTAAATASATTPSTVIFSSSNPYPFTVQTNFQGYCLFRWGVFSNRVLRNRTEQYFQKGEELNIQAQDGIRIWVSNAQAAKLQVIGGGRTVSVDVGNAGEVVVADIRWLRDDDNRYRLVLVRLDT